MADRDAFNTATRIAAGDIGRNYDDVAVGLHLATAILVVVQFLLGVTWDYFPDEWGSQWMDDAIREGIVATITAAPGEAAWYYGELTIQPHTPA